MLQSGQIWKPTANEINKMRAAGDRAEGYPVEDKSGNAEPGIVWIKNASGSAVNCNGVLGIDDAITTPTTDADAFRLQTPFLKGITPAATHACNFVILLDGVGSNDVCKAVMVGEAKVKINVTDESHEYATVKAGDATQLESAASGYAYIKWKESGTGTKWATVVLGENNAPHLYKATGDSSSGSVSVKKVKSDGTVSGNAMSQTIQSSAVARTGDFLTPSTDSEGASVLVPVIGNAASPYILEEGTDENPQTDTWSRASQPSGKQGVIFSAYRIYSKIESSEIKLYGFVRKITVDSQGEIVGVSAESGGAVAQFAVGSGETGTFEVSVAAGEKLCGDSFSVTVTAKTSGGSTDTTYSPEGSVNLTVAASSATSPDCTVISPIDISGWTWTNGVATGSVTVSCDCTAADVIITATDGSTGRTGASAEFAIGSSAKCGCSVGEIASSYTVNVSCNASYGGCTYNYSGNYALPFISDGSGWNQCNFKWTGDNGCGGTASIYLFWTPADANNPDTWRCEGKVNDGVSGSQSFVCDKNGAKCDGPEGTYSWNSAEAGTGTGCSTSMTLTVS